MSRVFLARERGGARAVVVKVLAPELAVGINAERFEREIRILASMQHRNIVPLLAAGRTRHVPYYMMPMVGRHTLRDRIARNGALAIDRAIAVLRDIARALAYAHERHVVHRDVKPGNVLLGEDRAYVSDFGIAKALIAAGAARQNAAVTLRGVGIGTPAYMSPEQAAGDPATDHRTDVYAFGCLAYEVFAGRSPFHGRSVHETIAAHFTETPRTLTHHRPDAPPHIARLIARCLEKNPDRRPQSAAELLHVLGRRTGMRVPVNDARASSRRSFRP
jgi:serine/threonine-protein kinase